MECIVVFFFASSTDIYVVEHKKYIPLHAFIKEKKTV